MSSSVFLAEFLGLYILTVSLVFLVRRESFQDYKEEFVENVSLRYTVAFLELAAGLGIILTHNIWSLGYEVVITTIGWLMFAESVFHLVATKEQEKRLIDTVNQENYWKLFAAISILLGLFLATKGFTGV